MRYDYGAALKNSDRWVQTDVFDSRKQQYQPLKTAHRISLPESKIVYIEISSHLSLFVAVAHRKCCRFFAEIIPAQICSALLYRSIEIINMSSVKVGAGSWVIVSRLHCMHIRDG